MLTPHEGEPKPDSEEESPDLDSTSEEERIERAAEDAGEDVVEDTVEVDAGHDDETRPSDAEIDDDSDPVVAYLKSIKAPREAIANVKSILGSSRRGNIGSLVKSLGVSREVRNQVTDVVDWSEVRTRIERLVQLGLPDDEKIRDRVHELIMTNRKPFQLPAVYAELERLGVYSPSDTSESAMTKNREVVYAVTTDDKELRKQFLSEIMMPPKPPEDLEGEEAKEAGEKYARAARKVEEVIGRVLSISGAENSVLVRIRLGEAGFDDAQIDKILKPVNLMDKFEGLRRNNFGGWGKDGKYHFVYEPARIAERIGVPESVLVAAAEKGIAPEYLVYAKENSAAAESLRRQGIDWIPAEPPPPSAFREVTPAEIALAKDAHGIEISPSYIEMARIEYERGNPHPADYLESLGIDLGVPNEVNPPDPIIALSRTGRTRLKQAADLARDITDRPGRVRRTLRRPGSLPEPENVLLGTLVGGVNSLIEPISKRALAWRVSRKEIRDRPVELANLRSRESALSSIATRTPEQEADLKELQQRIALFELREKSDLGLLHLGLPLYRSCHDYVDRLDESVRSHRQQLSLLDRHKIHDIPTAATTLAWRVMDARASLEKLRELKRIDLEDPEFMYNHARFLQDRKAYIKGAIDRFPVNKKRVPRSRDMV